MCSHSPGGRVIMLDPHHSEKEVIYLSWNRYSPKRFFPDYSKFLWAYLHLPAYWIPYSLPNIFYNITLTNNSFYSKKKSEIIGHVLIDFTTFSIYFIVQSSWWWYSQLGVIFCEAGYLVYIGFSDKIGDTQLNLNFREQISLLVYIKCCKGHTLKKYSMLM